MILPSQMKERVRVLKQDDKGIGPVKASIQDNKIYLLSDTDDPEIAIGDLLVRDWPDGSVDVFCVIDPGFRKASRLLQAHYQADVRQIRSDILRDDLGAMLAGCP